MTDVKDIVSWVETRELDNVKAAVLIMTDLHIVTPCIEGKMKDVATMLVCVAEEDSDFRDVLIAAANSLQKGGAE